MRDSRKAPEDLLPDMTYTHLMLIHLSFFLTISCKDFIHPITFKGDKEMEEKNRQKERLLKFTANMSIIAEQCHVRERRTKHVYECICHHLM